jgi:hypothetical protein
MKSAYSMMLLLGLLAAGCMGEETVNPTPAGVAYSGTLAVDIKGTAKVDIALRSGNAIDVSLEVQAKEAEGLVEPSKRLQATGTLEPFPENGSELYTAKFSSAASPGGPCGAEPVSLALSLHRRGKNNRVGGSLTAYCGEGKFHGVPVRLLRLTGELAPR